MKKINRLTKTYVVVETPKPRPGAKVASFRALPGRRYVYIAGNTANL